MDPFSAIIGVAGLGLSIAGGIMGQNDQEKLMRTQLGQERMLAQRDRLQQVRQLRTATASVQQAGANTGVGASSAISGGTATAYNQAGANLNYIGNQQMFGIVQTKERQSINQDKGISDLGQGLMNVSKDIFDMAGPLSQGAI